MTNGGGEEMEVLRKASSRALASSLTWFGTEYPKLIIQSGNTTAQAIAIYKNTAFTSHLRGAVSSAAQRGSSACIMFYGQSYIEAAMGKPTEYAVVNAGMAGFISGGLSSFVHSIFEPLKIRHGEGFRLSVYKKALVPMMWRHALFDMSFFSCGALLADKPYSTRFAVSALVASSINLFHDLWKTQLIKALPKRVKFITVLRSLTPAEYFKQMAYKSFDLGANWWLMGFIYEQLFADHQTSN
ncbi:hypothetical protein B484DRAFT_459899 [Ochromonadaceae sp. CCMP2298]|nr:hypothetical protein B484DRAFT_459899 [Ochromonadaceae sp. CCMP2298]|eukprot:CAMPEP_0173171056 /NCGR_PEP_ID=MMETSP1141-20130122/1555_1 /TAXON_ID=483371 /ORGANISM="non described non described, Strain CCMP2298" /LENGTH=241 /DNA_ID=CAMNT_0014092967 /DNA_START=106 /DNA_END=834 /DNA_ORIENTATION=-